MRYATWTLAPESDTLLSGPEQTIVNAGGYAEAAYSNGSVETGSTILGYFALENNVDLDRWAFTEITANEALALVQAINQSATINEEGRIVTMEEEGN